uniref:Plectin/eS10 N-terminal domain-containing protein n=1 Tax=Pseudictyota dubia TaxID=2749911 RepID=A0A7R9Z5E5_9STRA
MLISKKNRVAILSFLFKEGVLCAKKDFTKPKHEAVEDVSNLEVIKLMTSLKSRGYVTETFNWQWYYWYLTDEGIEYLRNFLHLPEEIVPLTLKKTVTRTARGLDAPGGRGGRGEKGGPSGEFRPRYGGEGGYRREGGAGRGRDL